MATSFLRNVLRPESVKLNMTADSKEEIIRELVGILQGQLGDPEEALRVVLEREKVMSTGMEYGIAIPHGKTDTVDQLMVAIGLKPVGLEFDCADQQPARIFILTLSPASVSGPHIRFMAEVTRLLRIDTLREQILKARSADDVVHLLTGR